MDLLSSTTDDAVISASFEEVRSAAIESAVGNMARAWLDGWASLRMQLLTALLDGEGNLEDKVKRIIQWGVSR